MKKFLPGIFCLLVCISSQAQVLYSTTSAGGSNNGGTLIKFIPATNKLTLAKSFEKLVDFPNSDLAVANDGKVYGLSTGGSYGVGYIFSYDPSSSTYTKLKEFDTANGAYPRGGVVQASDGKLYGITLGGGSKNKGVIFSFDPSSSTFTKLIDFDSSAVPYFEGHLTQARNGKLYGLSGNGGSKNEGFIFSFDPSTLTYKKLKDFNDTDGAYPNGSLVEAGNGKLYGTAANGGKGNGVIFSFDPSSSTYTKLKDFDLFNGMNGSNPRGSLTQASDGKLYGTTAQGGSKDFGVIFSFDPSSHLYKKLKDFNGINGAYPNFSLTQASNGKLYGMTASGRSDILGIIFSFDPSTSAYNEVTSFNHSFGSNTYGTLVGLGNGKLYGATAGGGSGRVAIFSFDPSSSAYKILKDFGINANGSNVSKNLVQANDGKIYGTTSEGGSKGYGVIFSFDPFTFEYKKLNDFDSVSGRPDGNGLMQASDGKLYGTTHADYDFIDFLPDSKRYGVIFSFDPSTSTYTNLHNFDRINGFEPSGRLIQLSDGKLYGTTFDGGSGNGVIFSFDPSSFTYEKLKDYPGTVSEDHPAGGLTQSSNGKLYGKSSGYLVGEGGHGVIFSFDPSTSTYTELIDFPGSGGGRLIQASDGKLYGTGSGSESYYGAIFSFDPVTSTYKELSYFNGENGNNGLGGLMQASDGKLYGMTLYGGSGRSGENGSSGNGVIFSFDPSTSAYTKLKDFNGANGANPWGSFIEVKGNQNTPAVTLSIPDSIVKYAAPARIKLNASIVNEDAAIKKVRFYADSTLIHTETVSSYGFLWDNVPVGNYTLIAKAYDDSGEVITSNAINISVVDFNVAPVVSIINPMRDTTITNSASIRLVAATHDANDKISKVEFYNGNALLRTEDIYPYAYNWVNMRPGTYTITAKSYDDKGLSTTSAPVTITVTSAPTVSSRSLFADSKTGMSLRLSPNPSHNILHVSAVGLQPNKPTSISIISASGVVLKTIQSGNSNQQLDVSTLVSGVYTVKIINGNEVCYKQFVKL